LVEDNLADADWIEEILLEGNLTKSKEGLPFQGGVSSTNFDLKHVKRVKEAVDLLGQYRFDAILLDLSLPDSQGINNITQVKQRAPELPIIVLTALNDQEMALESVRQGAQDYLIKGRFEGELLLRSIHYAIARQRTEATLRQQAERERLMGKMLERIRQSLNLQAILQTTVTEVRQFLQMDRVLIYRCDSNRPGKIIVEAFEENQLASQSDRLTSENNLSSLHLALGNCDSVQAIEDTNQAEGIYDLAANQIRAILTIPIWESHTLSDPSQWDFADYHNYCLTTTEELDLSTSTEHHLWGMLVAHNYRTVRKWQDWEIGFLRQLTTQVTIAIQQSELYTQLEKANQQLKQLAILDGLTSIANRRYFDLVLNNEWQRLAREQKSLSLILSDIDYFKNYNDTFGHQEGDRCLQQVAKILKQAVRRPADLVARYGGEEFAVILPNTNSQGALFVANIIRQALKRSKLPHPQSQVSAYVTLSIGTATIIPQSDRNESVLIKMADNALYLAKQQGRDRIVQAE
jgi:diguanylate cyclase (GGDEF)-like protein